MGVSAKHLEDEGLFGLVYKSGRFAERLPALLKPPPLLKKKTLLRLPSRSPSQARLRAHGRGLQWQLRGG